MNIVDRKNENQSGTETEIVSEWDREQKSTLTQICPTFKWIFFSLISNGKRYLHRFVSQCFLAVLFFPCPFIWLYKCNNNSMFSFIYVHFIFVPVFFCLGIVCFSFNLTEKNCSFFSWSFHVANVHRHFTKFTTLFLLCHGCTLNRQEQYLRLCLICRHSTCIRLHCHRTNLVHLLLFDSFRWAVCSQEHEFECKCRCAASLRTRNTHKKMYDNLLAKLVLQNSLS